MPNARRAAKADTGAADRFAAGGQTVPQQIDQAPDELCCHARLSSARQLGADIVAPAAKRRDFLGTFHRMGLA
ncbi:hypothetical protein ACCT09_42295, partial [Rhizobium ruizarguesonis]